MPRKSIPISPEALAGQKLLARYFASTGETLNSLANRMEITQSTLYRFYCGRTKTVSPKLQPALDYAHNFLNPRIAPQDQNTDNANRMAGNEELQYLLKRLLEVIEPVIVSSWPK